MDSISSKDQKMQASKPDLELAQENAKNWKVFWEVLKLMPLWFVMPMTAFMKMQRLFNPQGKNSDDHSDPHKKE